MNVHEYIFDKHELHIRLFLQTKSLNTIHYSNGVMPDQLKVVLWEYLTYFDTDANDLSNHVKQSPSCEQDSHSDGKAVSVLLWNLKFHKCEENGQLLFSIHSPW
jgi:hypothetical protein